MCVKNIRELAGVFVLKSLLPFKLQLKMPDFAKPWAKYFWLSYG